MEEKYRKRVAYFSSVWLELLVEEQKKKNTQETWLKGFKLSILKNKITHTHIYIKEHIIHYKPKLSYLCTFSSPISSIPKDFFVLLSEETLLKYLLIES